MLIPKETQPNDQGKKIFSYDSLKVIQIIVIICVYSYPMQSLQELNELRHTLQLRLFHQHVQERVSSLLLPILSSMPVNDKYAFNFLLGMRVNCT